MFDVQSFMPHGHCFLWKPSILWAHVLSDAIVGIAYYSIPFALLVYVKRSNQTGKLFSSVLYLFIAFIFLCGTTHFISIWTMWNPQYYIQGTAKALTAVVSIITALALWPLIPKALKIPTPEEMKNANEKLENINATLESRVQSETKKSEDKALQLAKSNHRLEAFNSVTVGREMKMIELKKEVNELCRELGRDAPYKMTQKGEG